MNQDLLIAKELIIKDGLIIKIHALDNKCSQVYIEIIEKPSENQKPIIYADTFQSADFNSTKFGESILFLKLVIQNCIKNGNQNEKWMKVQKVQNLIWQKIVVGKDKIDAALIALRKKQNKKKYEGIILNLQYPENILIVLPKVLNNFQVKYNPDKILNQKTLESNAKKIFFSTNN